MAIGKLLLRGGFTIPGLGATPGYLKADGTIISQIPFAGVNGVAASSHTHSATDITSGTLSNSRLNSTISSNTSGTAAKATILATTRGFSITGDITASSINFNGSGNVQLNASIDANVVGANELIVSGNGTNGYMLTSNGAGGFNWTAVSTTTDTWRPVAGNGTSIGSNDLDIKPGTGININVTGGDIRLTNTLPNVSTSLGHTTSTTTVALTSDGTGTTLPAATTSKAGVMTNAMVSKLNGIATGANNYSHPAYSSTNISASGATVIKTITTNSAGHITALATRTLTYANIGLNPAFTTLQLSDGTTEFITVTDHATVGTSAVKITTISTDPEAVFCDYAINTGEGSRAGTLMITREHDANHISWTDTSTHDAGVAMDFVFDVQYNAGKVEIFGSAGAAGHVVKLVTRSIF